MCLTVKTQVTTQPSLFPLPPAERQTLQAICNTFLPAMMPKVGHDPVPFALSADRLDVARKMEESFTTLDPKQQKQVRYLLKFLEYPIFIVFLIGKLNSFSKLAQYDRKRVLQILAVSKLEKLRMGFQAMKRLALFTFYSTTETREA